MDRLFRNKLFFPFLIVIITLFIAFKNYTPNTFLTGWDTLHPEFDFSLNFPRLLSVWHQEQGLGAITGHSQIADLPRVFILWLFHFILPLNFLRYSYIFLCLIIGPLGIYFLISHLLKNKLVAFLSSLFYLLNLSTLQQFFVPFEMFTTQWAFLPWIILFTFKFIQKPTKKNIFYFFLVTLFSTPQAYAAHLWYPFFGICSLTLIIYGLLVKKNFKKIFFLISFTLIINSFWLLPNLYFIKTSSSIPKNNKSNRLFSQEYLLRNRETGYINDVALQKGFYFNWDIYNHNSSSFENLLSSWQTHTNKATVQFIGYFLFFSSISGIVFCFIFKDKLFISFLPFFLIPFILLTSHTPPFSLLFDSLIKFPLFEEALRFIFTKFSILLTFSLVIYFSYFLFTIFSLISKPKIIIPISLLLVISNFYFCYPFFSGQLISSKIKIATPYQYFQLWDFMKDKPKDAKVLSLPLNNFTGWQYYNWGYQGSGFIWFGLKQSILDRDFDRWESKNEESYTEFFNTLYSNDTSQFSQTLNKYNIKYIIWDQNIITTSKKNQDQMIFKYETDYLIKKLIDQNEIKKIGEFENIFVYEKINSSPEITLTTINNNINPSYHWGTKDFAYFNHSDYYSDAKKPSTFYYPFRDLLTKTNKFDINKLSFDQNQKFYFPSLIESENELMANLYLINSPENQYQINFEFSLPKSILNNLITSFKIASPSKKDANVKTQFNNQSLEVPIDQIITGIPYYLGNVPVSVKTTNYLNSKPIDFLFNQIPNEISPSPIDIKYSRIDFDFHQIYVLNRGSDGISETDNSLKFQSLNDTHGINISLANLSHSSGYIIGLKSQFLKGIPLRLCLKNNYSGLCSFENEVDKNQQPQWDYSLIPSLDNDYDYNLLLSNISYGNFESISHLYNIVIIPIPYNFLSNIYSGSSQENVKTNSKLETINPFSGFYKIQLDKSNLNQNQFLVLSQSFNQGWIAFYFNGIKPIFLTNHVLVNNWSNGWFLSSSIINHESYIYIIFWPQLLEFFGLILLILSPLSLFIIKRKRL